MPNGHTHAAATRRVAVISAVAAPLIAYHYGWNLWDSLGAPIFVLVTLVIHNDLDLAENWPWTPWKVIWFPYAKVAKHRGNSHVPFLGTAVRIAYLALLLIALLWIAAQAAGIHVTLWDWWSWIVYIWGYHAVRWGVVAMMVSDTVHTALDAWKGNLFSLHK
jgi:uncharacterized metal-binding protein